MFEDIVKERPIVIDKSRKDDKKSKRTSLPPSPGAGPQTMAPIHNFDKVTLFGINGDEFIRITHNNDVYAYGSIELKKDVILDAFHDWLVDMGYSQ